MDRRQVRSEAMPLGGGLLGRIGGRGAESTHTDHQQSPGPSARPAPWISVSLNDPEAPRGASVTVTADRGPVRFERASRRPESDELDENAACPEATAPETVVVTME